MRMCRRAAIRPKLPENSLLNLEAVCEGLSHGHVAWESWPQEQVCRSQAMILCPWEVSDSLFSLCPSQVLMLSAGSASQ